ncbi:hypothetical protein SLE2022_169800 [Rubroshorea leprosula]
MYLNNQEYDASHYFVKAVYTKLQTLASLKMDKEPQTQTPRVTLGSQGLEVSRLGFVCAGFSGGYSAPLSHEDGCSVIKEAFSNGITFSDISNAWLFRL